MDAASYLAAMIDGEGWVSAATTKNNRAIRIANTERDLIDALLQCCEEIGVRAWVYPYKSKHSHWSSGWTVEIRGREDLQRVLDVCPIQSRRKVLRLEHMVTTFREPLDEEELRLLYGEGLTLVEIAVRLGVGLKRVRGAFKRYQISTRSGTDKANRIWEKRRANA